MAIVTKRGNKLHIQWFDGATGKTNSRSTKLKDTDKNRVVANKLAKELQAKLSQENNERNVMGFQRATIGSAFQHFLENNSDKNIKTIKDYNRFYKKFTETFAENEPCTSITKISAENWLNTIKKLDLSKNSIHAYGKQCNHFLNFLFEYSYVPMFKINNAVKTKPEIKEKIIFTDEDIVNIFSNLNLVKSNLLTTIYLLYYTGLRSTDIMTLEVEKIDIENRSFKYYSPKRKIYREIPFHEDLVPILSNRIAEIKSGRLIDYCKEENLGKAVTRYFTTLKINGKGYTARTFRKTFITLCRSRFQIDASIVRELVGHSHHNVADQYYNSIDHGIIKKELAKFIRPTKKEGL